ncbi:MAG: ABC transporter permease, partial [Sandaracinaceae bacterium]|nr:ABC transporter permease [Sandaracinaceae bacterium]
SLRSRKVIALLVLYVASSVASTYVFTEVLQRVEEELAAQLLVARTTEPGTLTQAVMESPELRGVLARLVRDDALAQSLLRVPPIALVYGWIALTFAPIFVALTSSDAIASEVATGSVRYALFRTDRAAWAAGKLVGQTALLAVGVALGAGAAWITGYARLMSFAPLDTAIWIARYALVAFFFAYAHLGLVLGTSQLTRSVAWSRALGLLAIASVFGVHAWLNRDRVHDLAPAWIDSLSQIFPVAHRLDLWRPAWGESVPAMVILVALGTTYFSLGYLRFARRDA